MTDIIYYPGLKEALDSIPSFSSILNEILADAAASKQPAAKTCSKSSTPEIPISRVIYSGLATTVYFTDGTKTTVFCSSNDKYDRQTAIAYALLKKIFGRAGRYDKNGIWRANEIDGNGIGMKLEKIAASGYDQDAEEKLAKAKKETAKANHIAKQEAERKAAWERKVKARAEELRLEREANALLDKEDSLKKNSGKAVLNESKMTAADFFDNSEPKANTPPEGTLRTSGLVQIDKKDAWKLYHKPDKPFSQFTQQEKREYWNYHNAKRRAEKAKQK